MRLGRDVLELDLYALLHVEAGATAFEIRRAYRAQVRASHPDLNPLDAAAAGRMAQLNLAAQVLLDQQRRDQYDRARGLLPQAGDLGPGDDRRAAASSMEWEPAPRPKRTVLTRELRFFLRTLRTLPGRSAEHVTTTLGGWPAHRHGAVLVLALLMTIGLIAHAKPRSLSFWCAPDCPPQPVSATRL
jgi:hypothetical protein